MMQIWVTRVIYAQYVVISTAKWSTAQYLNVVNKVVNNICIKKYMLLLDIQMQARSTQGGPRDEIGCPPPTNKIVL